MLGAYSSGQDAPLPTARAVLPAWPRTAPSVRPRATGVDKMTTVTVVRFVAFFFLFLLFFMRPLAEPP